MWLLITCFQRFQWNLPRFILYSSFLLSSFLLLSPSLHLFIFPVIISSFFFENVLHMKVISKSTRENCFLPKELIFIWNCLKFPQKKKCIMTLNSMYVLCLFARLFANPWTVARQAPLSMGFSRQEYWSGLPWPPPGDLSNPGIKLSSPTLQVDSLPSEPPRNPKNTGVGSLSLLQGIFPTQESNWGLLHCRWILHQLGY